jgi:hypothetical protein
MAIAGVLGYRALLSVGDLSDVARPSLRHEQVQSVLAGCLVLLSRFSSQPSNEVSCWFCFLCLSGGTSIGKMFSP